MKPLFLVFSLLFFSSTALTGEFDNITWITEEYPPYNYVENGATKGIAVEILQEVWKELGIKKSVSDIKVYPWARGVNTIKNTPNTCLFATTITQERTDKLGWKFISPIPQIRSESNNHLIALKSKNIRFNDASEIANFPGKFGVVRGDVGASLLTEAGVGEKKQDPATDPLKLVKKLDAGRIDIISYSFDTTSTKMKEAGIDSTKYEVVFNFPPKPMGYAFHHNFNDDLLNKLQAALDKVTNSGKAAAIREKYLDN